MHAIRRGEISAVHPNFYVDDSISQDESSEKNLRTLRSTPSRLAYQRAKSTMCSTPIVEQMKNKTLKNSRINGNKPKVSHIEKYADMKL